MEFSYWYKYGWIVHWKPVYAEGLVCESYVISRPGDVTYEELAKCTHKMWPGRDLGHS
jgi:hypothetical protein